MQLFGVALVFHKNLLRSSFGNGVDITNLGVVKKLINIDETRILV
jgi:hypothetical protein